MHCTKFFRPAPISPFVTACQPTGAAHAGTPRVRRTAGGRWLAAVAAGGLLLTLMAHGARHPTDAQELAWLSRLAAADDPGAQLQLGLAWRDGRYGLAPDARKGQYWLDQAARNGEDYAAAPGVDSPPGARVPAAAGNAVAARSRDAGRLDALASELDSPTLAAVSALWKTLAKTSTGAQSAAALEDRAESGDPVAEFQLAARYRDGAWAVNRDPARAYFWLRRSAGAGNPVAMRALSEVYRVGDLGVVRDTEGAARWEKRAEAASRRTG